MNRKAINTVMLLFTLSLTGFLVTQVFWISGSFKAAEESFRHMTTSGLRSVSQQMGKVVNYYEYEKIKENIDTDRTVVIDSLISPCGFEALMNHEFDQYILHKEYEYGIIDQLTGKLHFSSAISEKNNLIRQSPYTRSLKNIFSSDRYMVVVWFPHKNMVMLREQSYWLLALSCLLFAGIVTGYVISAIRLKSQKRLALMQRDFINSTTHEFKTPLATISIAAEMILNHRQSMPDHQVERYVSIIYNENKRLQHQVEQVMQASLLEEEQYRLQIKKIEPDKIIDRCAETARLMMRNSGGTVSVLGRCQCPVYADESHITNAINNLIENGIKYSAGAPQITLSVKAQEETISIAVQDQGIGIALDQQEKIFDRMYRIPVGDLYATPGTGIGLYYVKKIIAMHGGEIWVESDLGKGSTFTITLPKGRPQDI